MRVHQSIGLALLTIGFGVGAWALIVGTMSDLGVALSVWGLGSLLAPANPFAPALMTWWVGSYLIVPSPLAHKLTGFEALARWWQFATLAVMVPLLLLVVIPVWATGPRVVGEPTILPAFWASVPDTVVRGRLVWAPETFALLLIQLPLYTGWAVYSIATGLLAVIWIVQLPRLRLSQQAQWLGYVVMSLVVFWVTPAVRVLFD